MAEDEDDIIVQSGVSHHPLYNEEIEEQQEDPAVERIPSNQGPEIAPVEARDVRTNFDVFVDSCFLNLKFDEEETLDKHKEMLALERVQEKLGLFL